MKSKKIIEISLFGETTLQHANKSHSLARKSLGIFLYLVGQKKAIERQELVSLFWPDVSTTSGLQSLRALLYRYPSPVKKCLEISDQQIKFKLENVWLDTAQFEENLNFADQVWQKEQALKKTIRSLLEQAIELYSGEFAAGFDLADHPEFMGWLVQERQRYQQLAFDSACQLLRHYYQHSKWEEAMRIATESLRISPFSEDAHMIMMKLLVKNDDKEEAIRHFQAFQASLSKEMNATPGRSITTYYQQLYNPVLVPIERRVTEASFKILQPKAMPTGPAQVRSQQPFLRVQTLPKVFVKIFGRDALINKLEKEIVAADKRLFTLTGLGGIGKTQLALAIGNRITSEFKEGIVYIPLRKLKRETVLGEGASEDGYEQIIGHFLATETLQSLNIPPSEDTPPFFQLIEALGRREFLLIYDNFEHLIEGASFFTTLLHSAAEVTILVTSRIRLNQTGEYAHMVPPLSTTSERSNLHGVRLSSGVELFIDRAKRLDTKLEFNDSEIESIEIICSLVGGHPLAIEQAASWVLHYSLQEIIAEIQQSYTFLENIAAPLDDPHRSIRVTLESSYKLLSEQEQKMLKALSLFHDEFSRQAALAVSGAPINILISLNDRSLLQQVEPGWYSFHPLVAQMFAAKQSKDEQSDPPANRKRFTTYFLELLADINETEALHTISKKNTISQLDRMREDIHRAWRWGLADRAYPLLANSATALSNYFYYSSIKPVQGSAFFKWSSEQLFQQQPEEYLRQAEDAPPAYREALINVLYEYAEFLRLDFDHSLTEKTLLQLLSLLEGTSFYQKHAIVALILMRIYRLQGRVDEIDLLFQLVQDKKARVTKSLEIAQLEFCLTHFFLAKDELDRAEDQIIYAISLLDERHAGLLQEFYRGLADVYILQGDYPKALTVIANDIDIEAFLNQNDLALHHFRHVELLLGLGDAYQALSILHNFPEELLLISRAISFNFYILSILVKLEVNFTHATSDLNLTDFTQDAHKFIKFLETANYTDKDLISWLKLCGFAALVAGFTIQNRPSLAHTAFQTFLIHLHKTESAPLLSISPFIVILITHYLIRSNLEKMASKLISYLHEVELYHHMPTSRSRVEQQYEVFFGKKFERLESKLVPQNDLEAIEFLKQLEVDEGSLSDPRYDDTGSSKVSA